MQALDRMDGMNNNKIIEERLKNGHFEVICKEHKEFLDYLKMQTKIDKEIAITLSSYYDNRKSIKKPEDNKNFTEISAIEEKLITKFLTDMIKRNYEWNTNKDNRTQEFIIACCDGSEVNLNNKHDFIDDIKLLCILFTTKGGTYEEILVGSCPEMFKLFTVLMDKYNIIYNTVVGNPDFIYLMKIARCFPFTCCELYSRGVRKQELLNTILGKSLKRKQTAILCPVFPFVTTKYLLKKTFNILPQLLWISYNNFISSKISFNINPKIITLWCTLKRYLVASKYLNEKRKFLNCYYWNLIDKNGEPNEILIETRNICVEYLEKTFSIDENWENIKRELVINEN
ncbi:hypothetical protein O3M35_011631 [Rhynocoris fuscipes]|uniref:Uncharacterized protein n=1 Tax=Rhynocoris fuscipes TaxID=488301 RepID=A0AAW1CWG9_9HEMI